jgi:hypothetical protein
VYRSCFCFSAVELSLGYWLISPSMSVIAAPTTFAGERVFRSVRQADPGKPHIFERKLADVS